MSRSASVFNLYRCVVHGIRAVLMKLDMCKPALTVHDLGTDVLQVVLGEKTLVTFI